MEPPPVYDTAFLARTANCQDLCSKKLSISLRKYFIARLNGNHKGMSTDGCRRIVKMLHPAFKSMTDPELSRYSQVLRYYVKTWPRFDELTTLYKTMTTGKQEFINSSYKDFCMCLILKLEDAWKLMTEFKNQVHSNLVDKSTQAGSSSSMSVADFAVVVEGPASLAYSAVFNLEGGEVVLAQHLTAPCSDDYYPKYCEGFINLPYVSIRGSFADVAFERSNVHEIERFLTKENIDMKRIYAKTVHMHRVSELKAVNVYSKNLTVLYLRQFLHLVQTSSEVDDVRKTEFLAVVGQILKDVKEELQNIPTNVKITYNIGDNVYLRNKQTNSRELRLYEIITPKVALTLHGFSPVQDKLDKSRVSFESLNFFEKNKRQFAEHLNSNRLVFSCTLCLRDFPSLFEIHSHFKMEHREEHEVTCGGCKGLIKMADLVTKRWRHFCDILVLDK